jgi:hypothetical protein
MFLESQVTNTMGYERREIRLVLRCWMALATCWTSAAWAQTPSSDEYLSPSCVSDDYGAFDECCSDCITGGCASYCDPLWTVTADSIFLTRSRLAPSGVVLDRDSETDVVNFKDFDFGYETGPRVQLMRRMGATRAWSIEYFGIDKWSAQETAGPGDLFFHASMGGGPDISSLDLKYETEFHSVEINLWDRMNRNFSFFGGFRWLNLEDDFRVDGILAPDDGNASFFGAYSANNNLYGFQVGGKGTLLDWGRLSIDGFGKAGIYYNDANTQFMAGSPGFGLLLAEDDGGNAAFAGEFGINMNVRLTSHFALRGGYQVLWLSGIAEAHNQIGTTAAGTGVTDIDPTGSLFLHGAHAGFEISW